MLNLNRRFTKWYCRKGYRMTYDPLDGELIFVCPWWVRPIVGMFFSPVTYYREVGYSMEGE